MTKVYRALFTKIAPFEMADRTFSTIDPVMYVTSFASILVAVGAVWPFM